MRESLCVLLSEEAALLLNYHPITRGKECKPVTHIRASQALLYEVYIIILNICKTPQKWKQVENNRQPTTKEVCILIKIGKTLFTFQR